jgi:hypothetical protein
VVKVAIRRGVRANPSRQRRRRSRFLDELLSVHDADSVSELPLEDAMLIKTYQRAITGSRRAGKKIVKMILER